ncbi:hypothetical protein TWF106_003678 [Orbilia oligospora]|nr:hypothetical protein TWF788_004265 [Orbilia oligospora]KAF3199846.1 hypothetical protein TWF106_003678 [Orbilia oligospora]KAF3220346.1 hypothetical protein TWF679_009720 [Orbilia oligospora]KAF3258964.1 hypothetical protein TWF192_011098 [Orbilia oligospora]
MPLSRSEYLERSDVFPESSGVPVFRSVFVYNETSTASSEGDASDDTTIKQPSSILSDTVKKFWARIRSMTLDNVEKAAFDISKRRAALRFKDGLQAIDDAHDLHRISFGVQIPRAEFPIEHLSILDDVLRDPMTASLVVEGGDEDRGLQDDYINVSIDIRKNSDGVEVNCIILDDLD